MARCEDYPCCGHEAGDCPRVDSKGRQRFRCVECGRELSARATSSICARCMRAAHRQFSETGEMWDERGELRLGLALVSMLISAVLVACILGAYHVAEMAARAFPLR